jgi:CheY-like chemotaxis protein
MAAIPYAVEQIPPTAVTTATGEPAIAVRRPGAPGRSVPGGDVIFLDRRTRNRAPHAEFPAVRVLLADGEKLVRAALRELLEEAGDIAVTGEASSGRDAIALARQMRPDVVLMNVRLPGLDGLEATRRITTDPELTPARVLLVSEDERDEDLFGALRAGAGGS